MVVQWRVCTNTNATVCSHVVLAVVDVSWEITLFDRCEPADSQRVEVERRVFTRQNFFRVKNWQQVKRLILGRGGFGGCVDERRFICPRGKRSMCRAVNADVTLAEESPVESPARAASSAPPTRWL